MFSRLKNKRGFSFIDTILTTMVLSVGLYGTIALFNNSLKNSTDNNVRAIAMELATEKIEEIIADRGFQGYEAIESVQYPDEELEDEFSGLSRTTTVTEVSCSDFLTPDEGSGYKRIVVQVSWGDSDNNSISMVTVVSNYTS